MFMALNGLGRRRHLGERYCISSEGLTENHGGRPDQEGAGALAAEGKKEGKKILAVNDQFLEYLLDMHDTNKDGKVSCKEFEVKFSDTEMAAYVKVHPFRGSPGCTMDPVKLLRYQAK